MPMDSLSEIPPNPLFQVSLQEVQSWVSDENLRSKIIREFQGFELIDALDGSMLQEREVTLARLKRPGEYPQHVHRNSDAVFYIISGTAIFISGDERQAVKPGDRIYIPREKPHGFELEEGQKFSFLTIQSPPIRNRHTGEEDFHLIEAV